MRTSYAHVYNKLYTLGSATARDAWLRRRLAHKRVAVRARVSEHVMRLALTQARASYMVSPDALDLARREARLGQLARLVALRRIQRRVVRYLWRPGGALYERHIPCDLVG